VGWALLLGRTGEKREAEGRVGKWAQLASWGGVQAAQEKRKKRGEEGSWARLEGREMRKRERLLGRAKRDREEKEKGFGVGFGYFCFANSNTQTSKIQCNGMNARQTEQPHLI
jgi:hypothetical protein